MEIITSLNEGRLSGPDRAPGLWLSGVGGPHRGLGHRGARRGATRPSLTSGSYTPPGYPAATWTSQGRGRRAQPTTRMDVTASDATIERRGPAGERGYTRDRAQVLRRLSSIEGQVRGIARMVERDEYCIDILQQTAALRAAVDAVTMLLMEDHVAGCLRTAVKTGDAEAYTEEVMDVVRRSMGRPARASRPSAET